MKSATLHLNNVVDFGDTHQQVLIRSLVQCIMNKREKDILLLFKDHVYLFLERGGEKKRERNIHVWLPLTHHLLGT